MDNQTSTKPFIIVDGSSYLYRAFHAMPPLTNSKGEPTGAVYGVVNMLRRLLSEYEPEHVAVVFDAPGQNFRHELYPAYKSTRPPMPNDLRLQIQPVHQIIKAMGLPLLMVEGVEADDVIATLATRAKARGMFTLIVTSDKDLAQLVDEHVNLLNTMTNTVMDEGAVKEKFGVLPKQMTDFLTLMGDNVDNVPGVPNVGPKTAAKWLQDWGSLDAIMAHAGQFGGKNGEHLRACLTQLPLSRKLIELKTEVELEKRPAELFPKPPRVPRLVELFRAEEFKSWLAELLEASAEKAEYEIVLDEESFQKWVHQLRAAPLFAFDTETTSLDTLSAELVGVSFSVASGKAAYVPVAHTYSGAPKQLSRDWVLAQLKPLLEDSDQLKVGHNLKYDIEVLANYDIHFQGVAYDTLLESFVLNSAGGQHDLDSLALKHLGKKTIHYEEVVGTGANAVCFDQVPLEQAGPYAAEDADVTFQLHHTLWPELSTEPAVERVFQKIDLPLVNVLSRIERNGVCINVETLNQLSAEFAERIANIEKDVYQQAGGEFNVASPKQLQEILFDKLKLPVLKKTPSGQPSTAEPVLQELALDYPLPKLILAHRRFSKLKSTYTDSLPRVVHEKTGRVHTSYHQAGTVTGRLSSSNPNLQNIPARTEEGRRIRRAFVAPMGYRIVAADYSQIELRIMAHLSQDKNLLHAFKKGLDIHRATAAEILSIGLQDVTQEQRRNAKAINFGLIYGMSAFGLSRQLGMDRKTAQAYIDLYFARYPGVRRYMDACRRKAHQQGFVETLFGRRLYTPEIRASHAQRRLAAERAAINAPMQGTAADIIKLAMIDIDHWLRSSKVPAKMVMQVHDELVFEVADAYVEELSEKVRACMLKAAELSVPVEVVVGVGDNWDEAH